MFQRKSLGAVGMVCAGLVMPALGQPTQTNWTDGGPDANWNTLANWNPVIPNETIDALHTTDPSDILVNIAGAKCLTFTGDGKAPNDRFMLIGLAKKLHVFGDMIKAGTNNFLVKFTSGTGTADANRTRLMVDGSVTGFDLIPGPAIGPAGRFVTVDVGGGLTGSGILLGDEAIISTGGSVIDAPITVEDFGRLTFGDTNTIPTLEVRGAAMSFGTPAPGAGEGTSVHIFGSAGTTANPINFTEDWSLFGYTDVIVENDFIMVEPMTDTPLVQQTQNATLTVNGDTVGGDWHIFDDSVFTGDQVNTSITGGEWEVENDGRVVATQVLGGDWLVETNGGAGETFGVEVATLFDPDDLVVDGLSSPEGGAVKTLNLSDADTLWDMELKNGGEIDVTVDAQYAGEHVCGSTVTGFSTLTYTGKGNRYSVGGLLFMMGELIAGTGAMNELTITIGTPNPGSHGFFVAGSQLVRIDGAGQTQTIRFNPEGVTVAVFESVLCSELEVMGPDYSNPVGAGNQMDYNQAKVLFTDSPCVGRWRELIVKASVPNSDAMDLVDQYASSPISGAGSGCGPSILLDDALYVIDLTVEAGAELNIGSWNVYYTGKLTNNGTIAGTGSVTKLTRITTYGDFNGNKEGDETADTDRFTDAWCTCGRDDTHGTFADYDPLVDGDCDGDVDDADLLKYELNWGSGAPPNIAAFDNLTPATCPQSTVCH